MIFLLLSISPDLHLELHRKATDPLSHNIWKNRLYCQVFSFTFFCRSQAPTFGVNVGKMKTTLDHVKFNVKSLSTVPLTMTAANPRTRRPPRVNQLTSSSDCRLGRAPGLRGWGQSLCVIEARLSPLARAPPPASELHSNQLVFG